MGHLGASSHAGKEVGVPRLQCLIFSAAIVRHADDFGRERG